MVMCLMIFSSTCTCTSFSACWSTTWSGVPHSGWPCLLVHSKSDSQKVNIYKLNAHESYRKVVIMSGESSITKYDDYNSTHKYELPRKS